MAAKDFHVKTKPAEARATKADQTTLAAQAIIATDARASAAKTARLKELRLARDAEEAAAKAKADKPKKKPAAKKAAD